MTSENKFTITELCTELNRSTATINRKIKKHRLTLEKTYLNGRPANLVTITDAQLQALKLEIQQEDEKNTSKLETNLNSNALAYDTQPSEEQPVQATGIDVNKLLENIDKLTDRYLEKDKLVQEANARIVQLTEELGKANGTLLMIETNKHQEQQEIFKMKCKIDELEKYKNLNIFQKIFFKDKSKH